MRGPVLIALTALAVSACPQAAHGASTKRLIPPRPCPDLSQVLSYGRINGCSVADGRGGAFVAWADDRQVSVQRFGPEGKTAPGWPALGLPLGWIAPGEEGYQFALTTDGSGGVLLTWIGRRGEVRLQRVESGCRIARGWPADGLVLCDLAGTGRFPVAARIDAASAMVVWREQEQNGTQSIRLSRAMLSGSVAGGVPADGFSLSEGVELANVCEVLPDGRGGAFVSWRRSSETVHRRELVVQRIAADGRVARGWPKPGLVVAEVLTLGVPFDETVEHPLLATDGRDGAYVVWSTGRRAEPEQYDADVFVQRITGTGQVAPGWSTGGERVGGEPGDQYLAAITPDRGGVVVAWFDDVAEDQIRLARIGHTGSQSLWGEGQRAGPVGRIAVTQGGQGSVFVAWTSEAELSKGPMSLQWGPRGVMGPAEGIAPLGSVGLDPTRLGLVSDGRGEALMIWQDRTGEADPPDRAVVRISDWRASGPANPTGR